MAAEVRPRSARPASLRGWSGRVLACLAGLCGLAFARAHDAGLSVAEARLKGDTIELTVSFALADVQRMLPPSVRLGTDSSQGTIEAAHAELGLLASLLWEVSVDGRPCAARDIRVEFTPSDNLGFALSYVRPGPGAIVLRSIHLADLPAAHREVFAAKDADGRLLLEQTLTAADNTVRFTPGARLAGPPAAVPVAPAFATFFQLGIEHIWTGYDHLLFLFGLLLVCRKFRSMLVVVTSFTLAHSLTLALATLDVVSLPPRFAEPLIAASIVFVGVENLRRKGAEPRGRGWLTFAFGLIHGFGFASVLRDLGVGRQGGGIGVPLLAFNLGVEAGQVVVAALVLPVLARAFRSDKVRHRGVVAGSAVVTLAGLYWVVDRTFLA